MSNVDTAREQVYQLYEVQNALTGLLDAAQLRLKPVRDEATKLLNKMKRLFRDADKGHMGGDDVVAGIQDFMKEASAKLKS